VIGTGVRLLRLPRGDRRRLLEATADLTRASVELRVAPKSRTVARLGNLQTTEAAGRVGPEQRAEAERVGRAVARVARRLPWHPSCLRQALAVQRMLRRRGIAGLLHLGVTGVGESAAHAWVTVDGHPVVGHHGLDRFVPLGTFD
jgi:hypothetical protein